MIDVRAFESTADAEWAAKVMSASEPWVTLDTGYEHSLGLLGNASRERYLAYDLPGRRYNLGVKFGLLTAQLALIKPKVILALGATAAESLLQSKRSLSDLRLKVHSYRGTPLVVTYHPAALLRNPNWKKPTWDDVRIARQLIDRG